MLSSFHSMGLIVTSALWSELQEYGLLEPSPEATVAFEEEEAQSGQGADNAGRSVPETPEGI